MFEGVRGRLFEGAHTSTVGFCETIRVARRSQSLQRGATTRGRRGRWRSCRDRPQINPSCYRMPITTFRTLKWKYMFKKTPCNSMRRTAGCQLNFCTCICSQHCSCRSELGWWRSDHQVNRSGIARTLLTIQTPSPQPLTTILSVATSGWLTTSTWNGNCNLKWKSEGTSIHFN